MPVPRVAGTPEEVGRQCAELALRSAAALLDYPLNLLTDQLKSRRLARLVLPALDRLGRRLVVRFPERHRDFFPLNDLGALGLVTVYRSADARLRRFAAVGFPGTVVRRNPAGGVWLRGNPFDTRGRLARLERLAADVSQGPLTLQSMVFEPRRLALHLALGDGPATRHDPAELRLAEPF